MTVVACTMDEDIIGADEDMSWWDRAKPLVDSVAKSVTWKFKDWVEFDDVAQEVWAYYVENHEAIDTLLSQDRTQIARNRLRAPAIVYAQQEMCYHLGINHEDQFRYSKTQVRKLAELVLSGSVEFGAGEERVVGYADAKAAMLKISQDDRDAINYAYGVGSREVLTSTERSRVQRAMRRLQQVLNEPDISA